MEKVTQIASYLLDRYKMQYGEIMDEIKLQKLLYFIQREAIIRTGELMFDAEFRAWKYGPVILVIHDRYKANELKETLPQESQVHWKECFDYIFTEFAPKKTMNLVSLAHGEKSWIRDREGYGKYESSDVPMKVSDIFEDAEYRRHRRCTLPVRRAINSLYQKHPQIQRIPIIHAL
ncbi:MAG: SocA family protein [Muribaculaceae bacterium]|nr:SocA family protein [Muribaculaceae bacterium]